jgi:hypothetical protein
MFKLTFVNTETGTTQTIAEDLRAIVGILESVNWATTERVIMEEIKDAPAAPHLA